MTGGIDSGAAARGSGAQPVAPAPRRRLGRFTFLVLCLAIGSFGMGFLWFLHLVERAEEMPARNADGIVALTGGPFRINDALDLLAVGRGKSRVLCPSISAGSPAASTSSILPPTP